MSHNSSMSEPESAVLGKLDKAAVIALATPIAYLLAFQHERGYLSFFGLPETLVDVSLKDLLLTAAWIVSAVYPVYQCVDYALILLPESWPKRIRHRVIALVCGEVLIAPLIGTLADSIKVFLICTAAIVVLFLIIVIAPLIKGRNQPTDTAADGHPTPLERYASKGVTAVLHRVGVAPTTVIAVSFVLFGYYFASLIGLYHAMTQGSFLLNESSNGNVCAVIRVRDSDYLCADVDIAAHKLTGDYKFLKAEATKVSLRKTGRLSGPDESKEPLPSIHNENRTWVRYLPRN